MLRTALRTPLSLRRFIPCFLAFAGYYKLYKPLLCRLSRFTPHPQHAKQQQARERQGEQKRSVRANSIKGLQQQKVNHEAGGRHQQAAVNKLLGEAD